MVFKDCNQNGAQSAAGVEYIRMVLRRSASTALLKYKADDVDIDDRAHNSSYARMLLILCDRRIRFML